MAPSSEISTIIRLTNPSTVFRPKLFVFSTYVPGQGEPLNVLPLNQNEKYIYEAYVQKLPNARLWPGKNQYILLIVF